MRGEAPSKTAGIRDALTAFEFDAAATFLLLERENKRDFARLEALIKSIYGIAAAMFGGSSPDTGADAVDADSDEW